MLRGLLVTVTVAVTVYACTDWQALGWRAELAHWRSARYGAPHLERVREADRWIKVYEDKLRARGLQP